MCITRIRTERRRGFVRSAERGHILVQFLELTNGRPLRKGGRALPPLEDFDCIDLSFGVILSLPCRSDLAKVLADISTV